MNTLSFRKGLHRAGLTAGIGVSVLAMLASTVIGINPNQTTASSHREAPLISEDPSADNTDTYAFISPDRTDTVTLIGSWVPGELPQGGPNFYKFGDDVVYRLNVDNVGDAKAHIIYEFTFRTERRNPNTFLYNTGPVTSLDDPDLNVRQFYSVTEITDGGTTVLGSNLPVPPPNIGIKSTPLYIAPLMLPAVKTISSPEGDLKVFAGPTDDAFFVDLGSVFDLLTLRGNPPPLGYALRRNIPTDGLAGFNVHSIAIQVPIARLLKGAPAGETVIGVWSTTYRYSTKVLSAGVISNSGPLVQVSRLGMPLVNEVVIPLALKDAFNSLPAEQDFPLFTSGTPAGNLLARSVLTPEVGTLLNALYGVPVPNKPRLDLLAIFLTGMKTTKPFTIQTRNGPVTVPAGTNVNMPKNVQPAEMIRLNTAPAFRPGVNGSLCPKKPNYRFGLLGGDVCGFPNGRRLADDVTDIELSAVAGAAYSVLTNDTFNFDPKLLQVLRDKVDANDQPFMNQFPYLARPNRGQDWSYGGPNSPGPRALTEQDENMAVPGDE
ncbi:MAG: DUF4331 domain-containing protein [Chloroflexi bacterium]|nr:DUF4331 domain-containing protein [Chloroflexota bacterium]